MDVPFISVVLASYRQERTIARTLDALMALDYPSYEIIVVDSSGDNTTKIIKSYTEKDARIRLIELKQRASAGVQRNIGIRAARGKIIAITDTDCVPRRNWLRVITENISAEHPVIGGSFGNANPKSLIGWAGYLTEFSQFIPHTKKTLTMNLAGGNMAFQKEIADRYGYFPDAECEDLILISSWTKKSVKALFVPEMRIDHINRTSLFHLLKNQYRLGRGSAIMRRSGQGSFRSIVQYPIFIPLIWVYRLAMTFLRVIKANILLFPISFFLSPVILLSLLSWNLGFISGYISSAPLTNLPDFAEKQSL